LRSYWLIEESSWKYRKSTSNPVIYQSSYLNWS
jgi:hypothetical protein